MTGADTLIETLHAMLQAASVERLGWTLIHFLWEGTAIACVLAVMLLALRHCSARARHCAALVALLAMAALPVLTFALLPAPAPPTTVAPSAVRVAAPKIAAASFVTTPAFTAPEAQITIPSAPPLRLQDRLQPLLPWLVLTWLGGVATLSLWHLGGWLRVQRLTRSHTRPLDSLWQRRLADLCARLRVTRPVRLLESSLVEVPAVAGWLRPVILVPAAALSGLSAHELEAILAHELAHVRRHDYLVNVAQAVIETLLFYHPAVWWVSAQVRREREDCCDDDAATACGGAVTYARALASLEELRATRTPPHPALAATGSPLLRRVRRLLGSDSAPQLARARRIGSLAAAVLVLVLACAPAAVTRLGVGQPAAPAEAGQTDDRDADAKRASAKEGGPPPASPASAGSNADPTMTSKLERRDAVKSELARLSLALLPEHPSIVKLKKELSALEQDIEQSAQSSRARTGARAEAKPAEPAADGVATIDGRLLDKDNAPLFNWRVKLWDADAPPTRSPEGMVETDHKGHFRFENVPTGKVWRVTVAELGNLDLSVGRPLDGFRLAPKEYRAVIEIDAGRTATARLDPPVRFEPRARRNDTITPEQVARMDAAMKELLTERDKVKAELEQQLTITMPEHPRNVRLKQTMDALDRRIEAKRKEFAARPDALQRLAGNAGNYYIGGNVPHAGAYRLDRRVNLLQALIAAGFDVNAHGDETVRLFRRGEDDQQETVTSLTVKDLMDNRGRDMFLQAEDTIVVGTKREAPGPEPAPPPAAGPGAPGDAAPPAAKKSALLLITCGDNYFLEKAVASLGDSARATVVDPAKYSAEAAAGYDVVIFDRTAPARLPPRGKFIFVGACPSGLTLKPAVAADGAPQKATEVGVAAWKRDHPTLKGLDLAKLFVAETTTLVPAADTQVLVEGRTAAAGRSVPLVVLHHEQGSTYVIVPFDLLQSTWPLKVSFPLFLNQAIRYLSAPNAGG